MNTNRSIFALNGVTGMLIATVLLLSILGVLTFLGIKAQQDVAQKPYQIKTELLKAKSTENSAHKTIKE